jgi:sugar phosphate isomerase/epimerase
MIRGMAVSNMAWPGGGEEAFPLLRELGFGGVELAPAKIVDGWPSSPARLGELRKRFEDEGFPIVALQGILFGLQGVELFHSDETRARLFDHLVTVARVAGTLGAGACVFGAPRARDPGSLTFEEALDRAASFFGALAPVFESEGTVLAIEANAPVYGCRFITRTVEAVRLVEQINHPGIRVQLDTGTIFLSDLDPAIIAEAAPWSVHCHISEPNLAPLGTSASDHRSIADRLRSSPYDGWIAVEMREVENWADALCGAAQLVGREYLAVTC